MKTLRFLAVFALVTAAAHAAEVKNIAPADAARLVKEGQAVLIDVREPAEWHETGVAAPATLLAKSDFDRDQKLWTPFLEKNRGKQLIVYCRTGRRSGEVAGKLAEKGFTVANAGGLKDWIAAGLPTRPVAGPAPKKDAKK